MFIANKTINTSFRLTGLVILLFLGAASILGSGSSGDGGGTQPVITTVSPAQSSNSAVVTESITALFSLDMNGASFDTDSFTLVDNSMTPVNASSISYDAASRVATFDPAVSLESGMQYIATITTAVENSSGGNPLASNYVWSFNVAPTLVPASQDATGNYGGSPTTSSALNETGRYAVFVSINNLVAGINTGGIAQVYRKDTLTGEVELVSTDNTGLTPANGPCSSPQISNDGRYVVFDSTANNLVTGDTNSFADVFHRDIETSTTIRASVDTAGSQAVGGHSTDAAISADGRYVAFTSTATNLVAGDTNSFADVFRRDTQTPATIRVSVDSVGNQATGGPSSAAAISSNGHYVAFESTATNLVAGDTNTFSDVFLRDIQTPSTTRASVDTSGAQAVVGASTAPDISADGRYVVFQSFATNLVTGDTNTTADIFLRDTQAPLTSRESVNTANTQANGGPSTAPAISADGRYIAFQSLATNLVSGDINSASDIFFRDSQTPTTVRLSLDENGGQANAPSSEAAISANGLYVGFTTQDNLDIVNDNNGVNDIYRAHRSHQ